MKKNDYKKYCTGCGLCSSAEKCQLKMNEFGFYEPDLCSSDFEEFASKICPSSGIQSSLYDGSIWGKYKSVFLSYSQDENIRLKASSGGTITSICSYLLENNIVDGVLHCARDEEKIIGTKVYLSTTSNDVINRCGSRYVDSSPLINIIDLLKEDKKYAFVGRPCDIDALKNYSLINKEVDKKIILTISFFCAGVPSFNANKKLLEKLGTSIEECKKIDYRGNGWPGFATAISANGKVSSITYDESWGKVLGRDIRLICRFCMNGIGETADISCGDAWYIKDGKPSFEENKGRNITFCRTGIGEKIFNDAVRKKYVEKENCESVDEYLEIIQNYQYIRRATLKSNISAMRLFRKSVPNYDKKVLKKYSKKASLKIRLKRFIGTIRRIMKGKI